MSFYHYEGNPIDYLRPSLELDGTLNPRKQVESVACGERAPLIPIKHNFSPWHQPEPERMPETCFCIGCRNKIDFKRGQLRCAECRDREEHELAGMEHLENMRQEHGDD